ncbi:MAG: DNA-3-methyladenine glycosylase 2 family protein [Gemmatimonadetes bacterium]|nr:DNA-3-methyladenine glycosylase 2 family protein [Gemmatimonadota bacterium]NNM04890.1 DNA-3-methyladenine glycosylase 2 family protein [Gemmatimonadota bacterium]
MKPTKAQLAALSRRDPALGKVMKGLPPFPDLPAKPRLPYFHTLARIIIYQQLATGAARTIHDRVKALSPNPRRFPTAEEMLAIPENSVRSAGLSRSKLKAIRSLAERTESGDLRLRSLSTLPDQEVVEQLTAVWGIGEWSAQMFLLFHLGRLDIFAPGDLGLLEGIRILDGLGERPTPSEAQQRAQVWAPLRSVASWYLWRLKDGGEV